ncbi:hypothetical protein DES42_10623 [Zavarzinia compransoris]|uniref:VOC domain-containing protein n=2 Tax=Zavarzinia compransoris TaxID=1264899 RepID=A0A317DZJ0_9PROT|nr:hypothetical protein DKG75_16685 [Zavarzinia compransoris]TDP44806.1 hypothetical protein DES42_10623 [Zavarzinia compransoris]
MLFHASIPARDAAKVADVLAKVWRGEAMAFPPVPGAHVVFAGDERATTLEVYPDDRTLEPSPAGVAIGRGEGRHGYVGDHVAIASPLSVGEVLAIAAEAGWRAQEANRGDIFHVVELWLEDRYMVEVLTPDMQRDYVARVTPSAWRALLAAGPQAPGGVRA